MRRWFIGSLLLLGGASAAAQNCPTLTLSEGWIRQAPPSAPVLAAYGRLHHDAERSVVISAASASGFGRVELHSMSMDDGVMRMRRLDFLEVPAGGELVLKPGGLHLMLFEPARALAIGEQITLTLALCEDQSQDVQFEVRTSAPDAKPGDTAGDTPDDAHDHHHHH